MQDVQELEDAAWSSAYGIATPQQTALLDADPAAWRVTLERLVDRTDDLLNERASTDGNGTLGMLTDALGWLVTVGAGPAGESEGVGASVRWLGRVSLAAVNLVAQGRVIPTLTAARRSGGRAADVSVSWTPALIDNSEVSRLASRMPPPVSVLDRA